MVTGTGDTQIQVCCDSQDDSRDALLERTTPRGTSETTGLSLRELLTDPDTLGSIERLRLEIGKDSSAMASLSDYFRAKFTDSLGIKDMESLAVFNSWNELSLQLALALEKAQSSAYLASRYYDFRIVEVGLRSAARGCKINILHSGRSGLTTKLQVLGNLMGHPRALKALGKIRGSQNVSSREAELEYSFAVIDSRMVGVEIPNSEDPNSFYLGVSMQSPELAASLISEFEDISIRAANDATGLDAVDDYSTRASRTVLTT